MASSPSPLLLLELMADGENANTWGQKTNTTETLIENAIAKRQAISLGGVDVTLTDTQYADNQARSLCIALSGTLSANVNVIVPSRSKMYLIDNGTTGAFTVTVKTSAGSGVVVPQGKITVVYVDGTNVKPLITSGAVDADTLDGLDSTQFARTDAFNQFTKGRANTRVALTDAATIDVDASLGEFFGVTIAGNRTFTFSHAADGSYFELYITQDATGSRMVTWPSNIVWKGGAAPVLTTAANATDKVTFRYNNAASVWYGDYTTGLVTSGGGGSTISDVTITGSGVNMDIFALCGSPSGAVTVTVTIATGALITSLSPAAPAMNFSGFASGSVISLVNNGRIMGHGGRGGMGGVLSRLGSTTDSTWAGKPGGAGGTAVKGPGSGRTFNITNASGYIFGGGGGGGGGGCTADDGAGPANGGGGGGGAGGGVGGFGETMIYPDGAISSTATDGGHGTFELSSANGAAGTGTSAPSTSGGSGGAGGDWGAAGSNGASPTANTTDAPGGTGGAAGKAVDLNGGSATFVSGNDGTHVKGAIA